MDSAGCGESESGRRALENGREDPGRPLLDVRILLMAHRYVLTDGDVADFMERSPAGAKRFRTRIAVLQERGPYLGNLRDKVRVVAEGR